MRKTALSPVSDFGGLQFKFGSNNDSDSLYFKFGLEKICRSKFFFADRSKIREKTGLQVKLKLVFSYFFFEQEGWNFVEPFEQSSEQK